MTTPNEQLAAQEAQCKSPATGFKTGQCLAGTRDETFRKIEAVLMPAVKPEPTFAERIAEFLCTLKEDARFGAKIDFLDSINSVEELEQISNYVEENDVKDRGRAFDLTLFDFYRKNLEKFSDPEKEIDERFKRAFPLTASRLNTPQKMRIFLRGAEFCRVSPYSLADYTDMIMSEREKKGHDLITYRCGLQGSVLTILAFYTQLQACALRRLMFPGLKCSGFNSDGVFFDFRKESEGSCAVSAVL